MFTYGKKIWRIKFRMNIQSFKKERYQLDFLSVTSNSILILKVCQKLAINKIWSIGIWRARTRSGRPYSSWRFAWGRQLQFFLLDKQLQARALQELLDGRKSKGNEHVLEWRHFHHQSKQTSKNALQKHKTMVHWRKLSQ